MYPVFIARQVELSYAILGLCCSVSVQCVTSIVRAHLLPILFVDSIMNNNNNNNNNNTFKKVIKIKDTKFKEIDNNSRLVSYIS